MKTTARGWGMYSLTGAYSKFERVLEKHKLLARSFQTEAYFLHISKKNHGLFEEATTILWPPGLILWSF